VQQLSLAPDRPARVIAKLRLQADAPIKTDTRAQAVADRHHRQPRSIQLTGGSPNSPALADRRAQAATSRSSRTRPRRCQKHRRYPPTAWSRRLDQVLSDDNVKHVSKDPGQHRIADRLDRRSNAATCAS